MRIRILGTLATVLAAASLATADPGQFGSMSVFEKWKHRSCTSCAAPCEPGCVRTYPIPAPKLFRAEVGTPTYKEGKPLPPIELVRGVPPPVELVGGRPPHIELVRGTPPPVELVGGMPPPVELFRLQPELPEYAPSVKIPSVVIFNTPQPPKPCCPPPVCAPCCTLNAAR
jgi:hypothetical protein